MARCDEKAGAKKLRITAKVRGGGWNDFPKHIRSAYRAATPPNEGIETIGFRLARNSQ
jgi:formylglycine-generating enzyme required for sulfatase activity